MAKMSNLHKDYGITLDFFIMAGVGNLDTYLGDTLFCFHNGRGG